MQQPMTITEQRFRDASGERFLKNGNLRCQAVSKTRVRQWRLEHDDWTTPTEDLWPECQCARPALPGVFTCHYHGGRTPRRGDEAPRNIFDVMPVDLREKLQALMNSHEYISRREDILLIKARQWQLLEELSQSAGSEVAWEIVADALHLMRQMEYGQATALLEQAVDCVKREEEIWEEIYKTENVIKDLTNTEMRTAKELRLMVTADQVMALMNNIYGAIAEGVNRCINNADDQTRFLYYIGREFSRFTNLSPTGAFPQLIAGGAEEDGDAK